MNIWGTVPDPTVRQRAEQIGRIILIDNCVIDLVAAEIDGGDAPQLLVMMTPATASHGQNLTFPAIPAELERRFKAVARQLREMKGAVL